MTDETMILTAIVAMDRKGLIGGGMKMPWHLPSDLKRFRKETMGKPVIMGRKTFETLRGPLDGRLNLVLTHSSTFNAEGCTVARSIEEALEIVKGHAQQSRCKESMIIGGGLVFDETVPYWDRLLLTVVEGEFQGDTYFPIELVKKMRWQIVDEEFWESDTKNKYRHRFLRLKNQKDGLPSCQDFDLVRWLNQDSSSISSPITQLTACTIPR